MFSNLRERFEREDGVVGNVFMLASVVLLMTAYLYGMGTGKWVQGNIILTRCAEIAAKATMVEMQRQAPPLKGALTDTAKAVGIAKYAQTNCNDNTVANPFLPGTQTFDWLVVGTDTLVVRVNQYTRSGFLFASGPVRFRTQAAAYTYQYGGGRDTDVNNNPIYDPNSPVYTPSVNP